MTNLADRMLELLLFPLTDPRWVDLFQELELNGTPISTKTLGTSKLTGRKSVLYSSPKLGANLYGDEGIVLTIHFLVGPPYSGDLPFGLRPDFSLGDVHQLLGAPLTINQPYSDEFGSQSYYIDPYQVCVWYSLVDEKLDQIRVLRTAEG